MNSKEKSTEQLNIRVSESLIRDIELLAQVINVNKSEWIKTKLAELVYEEKNKLLTKHAELAEKGIITKQEVVQLSQKFKQK